VAKGLARSWLQCWSGDLTGDYPFKVIVDHWTYIASGLLVTVEISLLSLLLSAAIGCCLGVLRVVPWRLARWLSGAYVEFFRNVPPLVHLFFIFFALPRLGIELSSFTSGVIGLTVYHAAFVAEITRAGIEAVGRAQLDAARSLGFSYLGAMRHVILKQAVWLVLPPLGNIFISLIKTSSLVAAISATDLMYQSEILQERTFKTFEVFGFACIVYIALTLPLGRFMHRLERFSPAQSS
jgi:aspartate/glutamate/glutamine transport system permease protein